MLGNCLSACCGLHTYKGNGDYEPLEGSVDVEDEGSLVTTTVHQAEGYGGCGERRQEVIIQIPPSSIIGGSGGSNNQFGRRRHQQLQQPRTMGIFGGIVSDADRGDDNDGSNRQRTLGKRLLRRLRNYSNRQSNSDSGNSSAVPSCSDPRLGKILLRTGSEQKNGKTPEKKYLDEIVEEVAANMININQMSSSFVSSQDIRVRHKFYENILKQTNPKILKKNITTYTSLLEDCDFEVRNRLMKFDDGSEEGLVSQEDRNLMKWALEDLDEIVNCMPIEATEDIVVPFPKLIFWTDADTKTQN